MEAGRACTDARPVILALRFSALGDVAMTSGVIAAAARRYPGKRFVVVTRRQFAPFFPADVEVEGVDLAAFNGPWGMVRLANQLVRKYQPEAVADLHDVLRTKILRKVLRLRGVKTAVIDKGRKEKAALVGGKARRQLTPTTERYAAVFSALGLRPGLPVEAPLGKPSPAATVGIGIAPFAAHPGKAYPLTRMVEAADLIRRERPDVKIYWFSAPGNEASLLETVVPKDDIIVAKMCLGGLAGEIELMGTLDAMIAMDSGNMHMAALRGVPVVSVWGATSPLAGFAGATSPAELRIGSARKCRPCSVYGNRPCHIAPAGSGEYPCLDDITPLSISDKLLSILPPPR